MTETLHTFRVRIAPLVIHSLRAFFLLALAFFVSAVTYGACVGLPLWIATTAAILYMIIAPVCVWPSVFIGALLSKTILMPDGIWETTHWGFKRRFVRWEDIVRVKPVNLLGLKYLRVFSVKFRFPLWIPLYLINMDRFAELAMTLPPENNRFRQYFSGISDVKFAGGQADEAFYSAPRMSRIKSVPAWVLSALLCLFYSTVITSYVFFRFHSPLSKLHWDGSGMVLAGIGLAFVWLACCCIDIWGVCRWKGWDKRGWIRGLIALAIEGDRKRPPDTTMAYEAANAYGNTLHLRNTGGAYLVRSFLPNTAKAVSFALNVKVKSDLLAVHLHKKLGGEIALADPYTDAAYPVGTNGVPFSPGRDLKPETDDDIVIDEL